MREQKERLCTTPSDDRTQGQIGEQKILRKHVDGIDGLRGRRDHGLLQNGECSEAVTALFPEKGV